jgi:WD40 repeat protein
MVNNNHHSMIEPEREESLFATLLELPADQRPAYLNQVCAGDPRLREQLEELLEAHESDQAFMKVPAAAASAILAENVGDRIGRYKLMEQIGEGGCGVVYVAEQEEPVRRRVALKIIKLGMDTRQVIARFEAERQALALMDHPNIAKVLDAGATEAGRPYFVMELVRGVKITDYCDQNNLTTAERLKLFIQVCQAVQHAHQKGVIHRDLKPSNILVTVNDGMPVTKVIDFGIAKATQGRLTNKTIYTAFEQFIGTPAYMSPEQAVMTSLDIDTRSDIYSLGVLLYELLTGKTPFDAQELLQSGLDAMRRTIRETEPPKPSTRLSTMLAADLTDVAQRRRAEPPKLIHAVRGDLDWIVMKCLEKDRSRRYETANGLAADIRRHLSCEPVMARPPGRFYEFQKTVQRHKFGFGAAALLIIVLGIGALVSTREAIRATRAEGAQAKLREQAEQSSILAKANEEEARRQRRIASEQESLARRRLYAADMNLAMQAWDDGKPATTLELLESQRPQPQAPDLRGFEWYYLWNLCNSRLLNELKGHSAVVLSVDFSRNGKWLASASGDGTIRLWDIATSRTVMTLNQGEAPNIGGAFFTPDGKTIASWRWDHLIRLWDVASGQCIAELAGHQDRVDTVAVSPDGRTLASLDTGGSVRLWDVATHLEKTNFLTKPNRPVAISFAPDGSLFVPGSSVSWDADGRPQPIKISPEHTRQFVFSPDGRTMASVGANIQTWNFLTGEHLRDMKSAVWTCAVFLPDNQSLMSASYERTVQLWPNATKPGARSENQIIGEHLNAIMCVAISPDGKLAASGDADGSIKLWDVTSDKKQSLLQVAKSFQCVTNGTSDQNMQFILTAAGSDKFLVGTSLGTEIREISTGNEVGIIRDAIGSGVLSPDGRLLATSQRDGTVKLWEVLSGKLITSIQATPPSTWRSPALAFSPNGRVLVTGNDVCVKLWDAGSGLKPLQTLPPMMGADNGLVAFSPDGRWLAAVVRHGVVWILNAANYHLGRVITLGSGAIEITSMTFSPDSKYLATARDTGEVRLWNVQTGQLHYELKGHGTAVRAIAFAPDGTTVATGGEDQTVRLWDIFTGQEKMAIKRHKSPVSAIAFSSDGDTLLTGDWNGTVWMLNGKHVANADESSKPSSAFSNSEDDLTTAWIESTYPDPVYRDGSRAVELARNAVSTTRGHDADALIALASAYAESGQFSNAVQVQLQAISMFTNATAKAPLLLQLNSYESNSPYRDHDYWAEWARNLLEEGDFVRGESVARQCLAIRERLMPDDWRTYNIRSILGGCLLGQKRYTEADPLLQSGCEGMLERLHEIPLTARVPRVRSAILRLMELYHQTNRPEESAKWKQKLAEFESVHSDQETTAHPMPLIK